MNLPFKAHKRVAGVYQRDISIKSGGAGTGLYGNDHRIWPQAVQIAAYAIAPHAAAHKAETDERAAKAAVDPGGVLNPGVLIDP